MEASLEDPSQPDGMILRSTDSGVSWTRVLTATDGAGFYDLAVDPTNPDFILACGGSRTGGFLHLSDDGGENWREVFTSQFDKYFTSLASHPGTPGLVYAHDGWPGHGPVNLFRSTDGGDSWEKVLSDTAGPFALELPNTVWVAEAWGKIRRSTDGGDNWEEIGDSPGGSQRLVIDLTSTPAVLYAGLYNQGVWRSTDGRDWAEANNGVELPLVPNSIVVDPQRPNYLYTAGGYPGGFRSTDGGDSWQELRDVPHLDSFAVHPLTTSIVYAGGANDLGPTILRSTDSGEHWTGGYTSTVIGQGGYQRIYTLDISPVDPSVLYAGGVSRPPDAPPQGVILRSSDGGLSWTEVHTLTTRWKGFDVLATDPVNTSVVYAAVEDCSAGYPYIPTVHRSTNDGQDWEQVLTSNRIFTSLVIDWQGHIYVANEGYLVQKSTDGGDSWVVIRQSPMTGEDPPSGHLLAMGPRRASLYLAGMGWVGRSRDGGNTWEHLSDGLPHSLNPTALAIASDAEGRTLYLGGNGIWTYTLPWPVSAAFLPVVWK